MKDQPTPTLDDRVREACQTHSEQAALFEQNGNPVAAKQLRAVANMLGALVQGHDALPVFKWEDPNKEIGIAVYGRAGAGKSTVIGVIEQAMYKAGVGHLTVEDPDTDQGQRTQKMVRPNCLARMKVKLVHRQLALSAGSLFEGDTFTGDLRPGTRYADQPRRKKETDDADE